MIKATTKDGKHSVEVIGEIADCLNELGAIVESISSGIRRICGNDESENTDKIIKEIVDNAIESSDDKNLIKAKMEITDNYHPKHDAEKNEKLS